LWLGVTCHRNEYPPLPLGETNAVELLKNQGRNPVSKDGGRVARSAVESFLSGFPAENVSRSSPVFFVLTGVIIEAETVIP